ncbi:helix-turn-helix domain-containing protein [Streptomyces sp. CBMA29]|uniref:helix-turn-helix domain-containing protein n=1 Tax=Streptomyces sp. CBMA29 TaxID=1896314 RepID=UPI001661E3D8|nr:helix-turn-helix domain-containing protein [Streptomyces sp. CBMA29]MBD0734089.1 hypothetical protein [Streptomyces sp. CBMA29]
MPAPPAFYTPVEVAQMLRVSRMTVYRLIDTGELEAVRVGRLLRVPASALETFYSRPTAVSLT